MTDTPVQSLREVVGANVRRRRNELGLQAEELAKKLRTRGLNWNPARVSELEKGAKAVGLIELSILAAALGEDGDKISLADLLQTDSLIEVSPNFHVRPEFFQDAVSGKPVELRVGDSPQLEAWRDDLITELPERMKKFQSDLRRFGADPDLRELHSAERSVGSVEQKAARALGLTQGELLGAALALWNHSMTTERNNRAIGAETKQARGHVTRELMAELRRHIAEYRGND